MDQMKKFLDCVFERKLEKARIVLFYLPGSWSQSFDGLAPLMECAQKEDKQGLDVYVHTGTISKVMPKRPGAADIDCMYAVWMDFDTQYGSHAGKAFPKDKPELAAYIKTFTLAPTIVVDSGHGYHAWWALEKPLLISNEEERGRAASLSEKWQRAHILMGKANKWTFDSTMDLARILRLPGTHNHKDGGKIPVSIVEELSSWKKYKVKEFEDYISAGLLSTVSDATEEVPVAEPEKFDVDPTEMNLVDPDEPRKIKALVRELLIKDGDPLNEWPVVRSLLLGHQPTNCAKDSLSDYDFIISKALYRVGAEDEVVLRAMYRMRCQFTQKSPGKYSSGPGKLLRKDYLEDTKNRALEELKKEKAEQEKEVELNNKPLEDMTEQDRKEALARVSAALKTELDGIIQTRGDVPQWYIVINGKRFHVGTITDMMSATKVSHTVMDYTLTDPGLTLREWRPVQGYILKAAIVETPPEEMTDDYIGKTKLWEYICTNDYPADYDEAAKGGYPLRKDGYWHIYFDKFLTWINLTNLREKIGHKSLGEILDKCGYRKKYLSYRDKDHRGKGNPRRWYWRTEFSGPSIVIPETEVEDEGVQDLRSPGNREDARAGN